MLILEICVKQMCSYFKCSQFHLCTIGTYSSFNGQWIFCVTVHNLKTTTQLLNFSVLQIGLLFSQVWIRFLHLLLGSKTLQYSLVPL